MSVRLIAAAAVVLILVGGCGAEMKHNYRTAAEAQAGPADSSPTARQKRRLHRAGTNSAQQLPAPDKIRRKIIYRAEVDLVVEQFDPVPEGIEKLVQQHQGFIATSNLTGAPGTPRSGRWTVRVPVTGFVEFLAAVRQLGEPRSIRSTSDDVSAEFYDVEARIRNKRQEEERLLKLLAEATGKLEEVLTVETRTVPRPRRDRAGAGPPPRAERSDRPDDGDDQRHRDQGLRARTGADVRDAGPADVQQFLDRAGRHAPGALAGRGQPDAVAAAPAGCVPGPVRRPPPAKAAVAVQNGLTTVKVMIEPWGRSRTPNSHQARHWMPSFSSGKNVCTSGPAAKPRFSESGWTASAPRSAVTCQAQYPDTPTVVTSASVFPRPHSNEKSSPGWMSRSLRSEWTS